MEGVFDGRGFGNRDLGETLLGVVRLELREKESS